MIFAKIALLVLSAICFVGGIAGWQGPFGSNLLLALGASAILAHTAFNPGLLYKPFEANTFVKGQLRWLGKLGLLFLILGLVEASGALALPVRATIV